MLPVRVQRRDPAPSRIRYRLHRLWLRPAFRALVLRGIPALVVAILAAHWAADPAIRGKIQASVLQMRQAVAARPEFAVTRLEVSDVSDSLKTRVSEAVGLNFPVSSLDFDVADVRRRIMALDAVRSAQVRIGANGTLRVRVKERIPVVVWRTGGNVELLDAGGVRVAGLESRAQRPDLPLIVGDGANDAVAEALDIISAAAPISRRTRGLVRVGNRRWDVVLDRNQRIRLPADEPVEALRRVLALDAADELLERDVKVVDMRDARRPILRLSARALQELRRLRRINDGEDV